jgi:hypothetical protein
MKARYLLTILVSSLALSSTIPTSKADLPECPERIHGNGRIPTGSGSLARFAFAAVFDPNDASFEGAFRYIDKSSGLDLEASALIDYGVISENVRILSYSIADNADYNEARVVLTDAGKGNAVDTIEIQLLLNGNIVFQTPPLDAGKITVRTRSCL